MALGFEVESKLVLLVVNNVGPLENVVNVVINFVEVELFSVIAVDGVEVVIILDFAVLVVTVVGTVVADDSFVEVEVVVFSLFSSQMTA